MVVECNPAANLRFGRRSLIIVVCTTKKKGECKVRECRRRSQKREESDALYIGTPDARIASAHFGRRRTTHHALRASRIPQRGSRTYSGRWTCPGLLGVVSLDEASSLAYETTVVRNAPTTADSSWTLNVILSGAMSRHTHGDGGAGL